MTEADFHSVMLSMLETGFVDFPALVSYIDAHVEAEHPQANTLFAISVAQAADEAVQAIYEIWRTTELGLNVIGDDLDPGFIFALYTDRLISPEIALKRLHFVVDSHTIEWMEPEDLLDGIEVFSAESPFFRRFAKTMEVAIGKWRECSDFVGFPIPRVTALSSRETGI